MDIYTQDQMNNILELHSKWMRRVIGGVRADLRHDNLSGLNLSGVSIRDATLVGADLSFANLHGADLSFANLHGADLRGANLGGADLRGADLRGADLRGAKLCGTIGNGKEIRTNQTTTYTINICGDRIQIGCKNYSYDEWMAFSDIEIGAMEHRALDWWNANKDLVSMFYHAK